MKLKPWILTLISLLLCLTVIGCADTNQTDPESGSTSHEASSESVTENKETTSDTEAVPCQHSYERTATQEPTCQTAGSESFTCTLCGDSYRNELAMLSHDYQDATCQNPKTCSRCQTTEGKALGHSYQDATCQNPKTCSRCQTTEGKALGHSYQDATCQNPKTCSRCQTTEGKALGHDYQGVVCSRCDDVCRLYKGFVFFNWYDYSTHFYEPLNNDGTISNQVIFENSSYSVDLSQYFDEESFIFQIPESAMLDAIRKIFVFSDAQFAEMKRELAYNGDDYENYYQDGYFFIPGSGMGGFTPEFSHAIVGSISRPGELTVYVEYASTDGLRYEPISYYAVTYEYQGDTVFTVFGHHDDDGNHITATDSEIIDSLRIKGVTELTELPADMVPAIQKTLVSTSYEYYGWEGEPWESDELNFFLTVYVDETKPHEIETNISCCGNFHIDGLTITCDCGKTSFTEADLDPYYSVYREYTYGIYAKALGFK